MYWRTTLRSLRAITRQSSVRGSSPGAYGRCSANSIETPLSGLVCLPVRVPCMRRRASHSSRRITASVSSGSSRMQAGNWGIGKKILNSKF